MEHPSLRFALIGFSAGAQRELSRSLASQPSRGPRWSISHASQADAWIIHPQAVAQADAIDAPFMATEPDGSPEAPLLLSRLRLPFIVAQAHTPRPGALTSLDADTLSKALQHFEGQLRLLRVKFTLGDLLLNEHPTVPQEQRVHQLTFRTQLIAVVDAEHLRVAIGPKAVPLSVAEAQWQVRPNLAQETPPEFVTASLLECMWQFSQRSQGNHLPSRYFSKPIYFWRTPNMSAAPLEDPHLGILDMLRSGPMKFEALLRATGWDEPALAKVIEGLYVTGAVSTQPHNTERAPHAVKRFFSRKQFADSGLMGDSNVTEVSKTKSLDWAMDTVPAALTDRNAPTRRQ